MSRSRFGWSALAGLLGLALIGAPATAQVCINFEGAAYNGDADGEIATGQDGWYNPVAGSVDGLIFDYAGNTYGIAANSTGGQQFLASRRTSVNCARAQRDVAFGNGLDGCHTMCFDLLGNFTVDADSDPAGPGGGRNNLGSMSIQPYPANGAILLAFWGDPNDPNFASGDTWNLGVIAYDANGVLVPGVLYFPGSQFSNIAQNTWMRICVNIDLDNNRMNRIEIGPVGGSNPDVFIPDFNDPFAYFYLGGGSVQTGPINGVRLFGGGGVCADITGSGNTLAMDNLAIYGCGGANPCGGPQCSCTGDIAQNNQVDINDLTLLLANFGSVPADPCIDVNGSGGAIDLSDLTLLLARFGTLCP